MKIVSGGQTGVDRAALDVALELGLACGGWCPRGRRAEDGRVPEHYPLVETPSPRYDQRTRWNVRDSDATLIVTVGSPTGGTALTVRAAAALAKPLHVVDLDLSCDPGSTREWLAANAISTLNVAGPRESGQPGIQMRAASFLGAVLTVVR